MDVDGAVVEFSLPAEYAPLMEERLRKEKEGTLICWLCSLSLFKI